MVNRLLMLGFIKNMFIGLLSFRGSLAKVMAT